METMLKIVFDYQRFSPNRRLSAMIADTQARYSSFGSCALELSDDDLDFIAAAGSACKPEEEENDDRLW